jgi:hypothetical protein
MKINWLDFINMHGLMFDYCHECVFLESSLGVQMGTKMKTRILEM